MGDFMREIPCSNKENHYRSLEINHNVVFWLLCGKINLFAIVKCIWLFGCKFWTTHVIKNSILEPLWAKSPPNSDT